MSISLALQLALHEWAPLRALFHTEPLSASAAGLVISAAVVPTAAFEMYKWAREAWTGRSHDRVQVSQEPT